MDKQKDYDLDFLNYRFKVIKQGNSYSLRIPQHFAESIGINENTLEATAVIHEIINKDRQVISLCTIQNIRKSRLVEALTQ